MGILGHKWDLSWDGTLVAGVVSSMLIAFAFQESPFASSLGIRHGHEHTLSLTTSVKSKSWSDPAHKAAHLSMIPASKFLCCDNWRSLGLLEELRKRQESTNQILHFK